MSEHIKYEDPKCFASSKLKGILFFCFFGYVGGEGVKVHALMDYKLVESL